MKKNKNLWLLSVCVVALCSLALFESCDEGEEPINYAYYFEILDKDTGKDFFLENPTYDFNKIKHYDDNTTSIGDTSHHGNRNLLWISAKAKKKFYIDYGNGDIDTVTQTAEPMKPDGDFPSKIDKAHFYLNGVWQFTFDFKADDTLKTILEKANSPTRPSFDPIAITLKK